ncbi:hypothetical protein RFI_06368 [Reticulomyxa filosa]|uniref:C2H2-type domain-containing protein n=1 Tax=Reticulomyxa filosa TaxID=46433 RepID=X6NY41_RETFI|nr:hypothetical protein RFI_06368 [Reticulomyxa filosa]|eukprot:ETO30754.1 hypothetical protein RFI_06368 [Reticulomyxa filosa]
MDLLVKFGTRINKTIILKSWMECNQIYWKTVMKLGAICATTNIYELTFDAYKFVWYRIEEKIELKIKREICLHILWNILKYPKNMKYQQISTKSLYDNLKWKCYQLDANIDEIFEDMKCNLREFGFEQSNDDWYYPKSGIQLLKLWECYKKWINEQIIYGMVKRVCMLKKGKWKDYEILFDYQHRSILLLNTNKDKLKTEILQVGNPKRLSLEFNVHIRWYNDFNAVDTTHSKWTCLVLNHSWHFRSAEYFDRKRLTNFCSEFNSFSVIWKDCTIMFKEPLDPFFITLKRGMQQLENKMQIYKQFTFGTDELIFFKYELDKCEPGIPANIGEETLLHDIYKHLPHYPILQVRWEVIGAFMVSYKYTIGIDRINLAQNVNLDTEFYPSMTKPKFNPLLYECDVRKLKAIESIEKMEEYDSLQLLLHEIIENGYLCDIITYQYTKNKQEKKHLYKKIKQQIHYNENNPEKLILNDNILTILNELKILYHDDIHKQMGYPLQLWHICAILLYCGKSCNSEFSYDQIQFRHRKWRHLDSLLYDAINVLHKHERREESNIELYCGLKGVRLENIKEIKEGFFISHVSTSDDIQVAQMFRTSQGCILHFHPSMRRPNGISSCDVAWISPFKNEREILFARLITGYYLDEETHKELYAWNAKIESEDEHTQMILLTWARYDVFVQQVMQISKIWNHSIDLNVIYLILNNISTEINKVSLCLLLFEEWKLKDNNKQKYKEKMNEFMERRCCNHEINLLSIFLIENGLQKRHTAINFAKMFTARIGLPFVEKIKKLNKITNVKIQSDSVKLITVTGLLFYFGSNEDVRMFNSVV